MVALLKLIQGAITTSLKSVVNHDSKQISKGRDETECPLKSGRVPNRKMAICLLHLQVITFKFGMGVMIATSNLQRCTILWVGNYGRINRLDKPHHIKQNGD